MKRVLLAEDDLDDQQLFTEVLQDIDPAIEITCVGDGEQVLPAIKQMETTGSQNIPDLIVLDQNMPRLKGSETIKLLRNTLPYNRIPTVIYSTYLDSQFIEYARSLDLRVFLKPDTYTELKSLIAGIIKEFDNP